MTVARVALADLSWILRQISGAGAAERLGADALDVTFHDLGYDSLALAQAVGRIGTEYGIVVPEEAIVDAETPRMLLAIIAYCAHGGPADEPVADPAPGGRPARPNLRPVR
ncbi:MAG TPA: acyl carrier protein [Mycobacteriales bacterium]|nr:acyl carrier protein [Mycobacteriales bacterium]